MDSCMVQSKRSISSSTLSLSGQPTDRLDSIGALNGQTEFLNQGLLLWNQIRQQKVSGSKRTESTSDLREPRVSWNATYNSLLGSNKLFWKPIPLFEMVDFLQDMGRGRII